MIRKLRGGIVADEGMSVLEVVLAALILFFVLTAVLGLVGASTQMSLDAKQRAAMTNAVSSHLEWIRTLDFEDVELTANGGTVDSQRVVTVDGYTVTIDTQIDQGDAGTKEVTVNATADSDSFGTMSTSVFSIIRDRERGITQILNAAGGPEIYFNSSTPDEDSIVYGQYVLEGAAALYVSVHAEAADNDGVISDLRMYCSGALLRDNSTIFANVAAWQPNAQSTDKTFRWETRQVDEDGNPAIEDGWRIVRVVATDGQGQQAVVERQFYVDNYAPGPPGTPVAQVNTDVETRLEWPHAQDGTSPPLQYGLQMWKIRSDGSLPTGTNALSAERAYIHTTEPFSRYMTIIRSVSPRNYYSDWVPIARPYVSRARLTGTSHTVAGPKVRGRFTLTSTANLSVTPPSFAVSSIRYDLHRKLDASPGDGVPPDVYAGSAYMTDVGPNYTDVITKEVKDVGDADPYYYAYKITFTPSGYRGGEEQVVWSNIIGPMNTSSTPQSMAHASW